MHMGLVTEATQRPIAIVGSVFLGEYNSTDCKVIHLDIYLCMTLNFKHGIASTWWYFNPLVEL